MIVAPLGALKGGCMTRQQIRAEGRKLKKLLLKLNDQDAYIYLTEAYKSYTDNTLNAVMETLRKDFGFGDKRIGRLQDGVKRRIGG